MAAHESIRTTIMLGSPRRGRSTVYPGGTA